MDYFTGLTDLGLRRIYKFVLKRLLGKYLRDEFRLDQLLVNSRTGIISLTDLTFDVETLSDEFLSQFPFKLSKLTINTLEISLSYLNILSESCVISIDTIEIVIRNGSVETKKSEPQPGRLVVIENDEISLALEGEKGLSFIAHWIETILNQLQIRVNTLKIALESESKDLVFELNLRDILYSNGDATEFTHQVSSSQFAASLVQDSNLKLKFLSRSKKVLNVGSFLGAITDKVNIHQHEVCTVLDPTKLSFVSDSFRTHNTSSIDMDIKLPQIHLKFNPISLSLCLRLFTCLFSSVEDSSNKLTETAPLHRKQGGNNFSRGNSYSDGNLLSQEIRKIYDLSSHLSPQFSSDDLVESDGEFPPDSEEDEEEYFDPLTQSKAYAGVSYSANFFSLYGKPEIKKEELRVRLYCVCLKVDLLDVSHSGRLALEMNECILTTSHGLSQQGKIECFKLSIADLVLNEIWKSADCLVVKSFADRKIDGQTIYSNPHIVTELRFNSREFEASVSLQSLEIFVDVEIIKRWSDWLSQINCIELQPSPNPTSNKLNVNTQNCRCFLKSAEAVEIQEFLTIASCSKSWKQRQILMHSNLPAHRAGLLIEFIALQLAFSESKEKVDLLVHTQQATLGLYFRSAIGTVQYSQIVQAIASSTFHLQKFRNALPSALIITVSNLSIGLNSLQFSLFLWMLKSLANTESKIDGNDHFENFQIKINLQEYYFAVTGNEEFDLLNLIQGETSLRQEISFLIEHGVEVLNWGLQPGIFLSGSLIEVEVLLQPRRTEFLVSSDTVTAKELFNIRTGVINEPLFVASLKGKDFAQAESASDQKIKVTGFLQNNLQSCLHEITVFIPSCSITLYSDSHILLSLPNLIVPSSPQSICLKFYQLLHHELQGLSEQNPSDTSHLLVTLSDSMQRLLSKQSHSFIDSIKVSIECKDLAVNLKHHESDHSCAVQSRDARLFMNQLSNMKTYSLKTSLGYASFQFLDTRKVKHEFLNIDFVSALVTIFSDKATKQWIELSMGTATCINSVVEILHMKGFFDAFISKLFHTFSSFLCSERESEKLISERKEDNSAWSNLFARESVQNDSEVQDLLKVPETLPLQSNEDLMEHYFDDLGRDTDEGTAESLWEADYGTEDDRSRQFEFNTSVPVRITETELESVMDALTTSNISETYKNVNFQNNFEIELQSEIKAKDQQTASSESVLKQIEPGLTKTELAEMKEIDFAWRDDDIDGVCTENSKSREHEQQATWFINPELLEVNHTYLHTVTGSKGEAFELISNGSFVVAIRLSGNLSLIFREEQKSVSIFSPVNQQFGQHKSAATEPFQADQIEISLRDISLEYFQFPNDSTVEEEAGKPWSKSISKLQVSVRNFLVSHRSTSKLQHYKVLGLWNSSNLARNVEFPIVKLSLLGFYNEKLPSSTEYRVKLSLSPVRCHLTEQFIIFIKSMIRQIVCVPSPDEVCDSSASSTYFQHISVQGMEIKIDYHATNVNLAALNEGDYLQLLNIFPLDGLQLHLKAIKLNGINGISALMNSILQIWVTDIYKNQLHRVLTGTTPFRSLSHVGLSLKSLLFIPIEQSNKRRVWKHVGKGAKSVLSAVTTEALSLTHQVSLFFANTISELASEGKSGSEDRNFQPRNVREGFSRAVQNFSQEISQSINHIVAVPLRQYERNGATGVVTSVIRAIPVALLKPIAGVAQGLSYTVLGLRNSLNPMQATDEEDWWTSLQDTDL